MATFTETISAQTRKSGAFRATVSAGANITLSADSAAKATIIPTSFIAVGPPAVLGIDNNDGRAGDDSAIVTGATSWTVPAAAGESGTVFIAWEAYNYRGPGSITIGGLDAVDEDSETSTITLPRLSTTTAGASLSFPPEGGTRDVEINFPYARRDALAIEIVPGNRSAAPLKTHLGVSIVKPETADGTEPETLILRVKCEALSPATLYSSKRLSGDIVVSVSETAAVEFSVSDAPLKLPVSAGYLIGEGSGFLLTDLDAIRTANGETELLSRARDMTGVNSIVMSNTPALWRAFAPVLTAEVAGTGAGRVVAKMASGAGSGYANPQTTNGRHATTRLEFEYSETEATDVEVVITPDISPRSAVRMLIHADPYTLPDVPGIWIWTFPEEIQAAQRGEFDSDTNTYAPVSYEFDVFASEACGAVSCRVEDVDGAKPSWTTASFSDGNKSGALWATSNTFEESRFATVVLTGEHGGVAVMPVRQAGTGTDMISPDVFRLYFGYPGGSREVRLARERGTGVLTIDTHGADWIKVEDKGGDVFAISASENTDKEWRYGYVSFYGSTAGAAHVAVIQAADRRLEIEPWILRFSSIAGTQRVSITNGNAGTLTAAVSADWLAATADGDVSVEANTTGAERSATVSWTGEAGGHVPVTVVQAAASEPVVTVKPGELTFAACGGEKRLAVEANAEAGTADVICVADWLAATADGVIIAEENTTGAQRSAEAVYYGANGGAATVAITQDAYADGGGDASLEVSPGMFFPPAAGGELAVSVKTSGNAGEVFVSSDADWLAATADGKIAVEASPAFKTRTGTLVFRAGNLPEAAAVSVIVHQLAARRAPGVFFRKLRAEYRAKRDGTTER